MLGAPAAHFFHEGDEIATGFGERVGDLGRRIESGFASTDTVSLEFAELRGEDFFCDAGKEIAKFGKALRFEREIPQGQDFPFAGEDVEGGFDRTAVMLLHKDSGGLQNCAYFRAAKHSYSMTGRRRFAQERARLGPQAGGKETER